MHLVNLCRFDSSKKLVVEEADIHSTEYIGISHVWMEASWTDIPGIPFKVLVSPHKAKFIQDRLPDLVGDSLFWMDVLVVDQSKDEERVKVVTSIPAIYRNAVKTIVIRESGGFGDRCEKLVSDLMAEQFVLDRNERVGADVLDREDVSSVVGGLRRDPLRRHAEACHPNGIDERWLNRLWPLQEAFLSETLEFTMCEGYRPDGSRGDPGLESIFDFFELYGMIGFWITQGRFACVQPVRDGDTPPTREDMIRANRAAVMELMWAFLRAFFRNGSVSRANKFQIHENFEFQSIFGFLGSASTSRRRTGKGRDFILAIFPSCPWYRVPPDPKRLGFGPLWADAVSQLDGYHDNLQNFKNNRVKPKITNGVLYNFNVGLDEGAKAATDVPTPRDLADFQSLLSFQPGGQNTFSQLLALQRGRKLKLLPACESDIPIKVLLIYVLQTMHGLHTTSILTSVANEKKVRELAAKAPSARQVSAPSSLKPRLPLIVPPSLPGQHLPWGLRDEGTQALMIEDWSLDILELLLRGQHELAISRQDNDGSKPLTDEALCVPPLEWHGLKVAASLLDDTSRSMFRRSFLQLAVLLATGIGLNALEWSKGKLEPYLLYHCDPEGPALSGEFVTMVLAAPDLKIQDDDYLELYAENNPYLVSRSPRDGMQPRVIGLTAPPPSQQDYCFLEYNLYPYLTSISATDAEAEAERLRVHELFFSSANDEILKDETNPMLLRFISDMITGHLEDGVTVHDQAIRWAGLDILARLRCHGGRHPETLESVTGLLDMSRSVEDIKGAFDYLEMVLNDDNGMADSADYAEKLVSNLLGVCYDKLEKLPAAEKAECEIVVSQLFEQMSI